MPKPAVKFAEPESAAVLRANEGPDESLIDAQNALDLALSNLDALVDVLQLAAYGKQEVSDDTLAAITFLMQRETQTVADSLKAFEPAMRIAAFGHRQDG